MAANSMIARQTKRKFSIDKSLSEWILFRRSLPRGTGRSVSNPFFHRRLGEVSFNTRTCASHELYDFGCSNACVWARSRNIRSGLFFWYKKETGSPQRFSAPVSREPLVRAAGSPPPSPPTLPHGLLLTQLSSLPSAVHSSLSIILPLYCLLALPPLPVSLCSRLNLSL